MDHSRYDKRNYPIVDVRRATANGCGLTRMWCRTRWIYACSSDCKPLTGRRRGQILDLACGTGRIGEWLKARTSMPLTPADQERISFPSPTQAERGEKRGMMIDGVDLTPEMLDVARGKGIYRTLYRADVTARDCLPRAMI